jgi:hypothetical protein
MRSDVDFEVVAGGVAAPYFGRAMLMYPDWLEFGRMSTRAGVSGSEDFSRG